jgi:mannitol-specific phosphotransferase system IIBC component
MVVAMVVSVVVSVVVSMVMSVMGVAKSKQADDINQETENADGEQFIQPSDLMAFL